MCHSLPASGIKRENMQRSAKASSLKLHVFIKSVDKAARVQDRAALSGLAHVNKMVFYSIALRQRKDIRRKKNEWMNKQTKKNKLSALRDTKIERQRRMGCFRGDRYYNIFPQCFILFSRRKLVLILTKLNWACSTRQNNSNNMARHFSHRLSSFLTSKW